MPSIQLKNPRVHEVVKEEVENGVGRNLTEAAENMILADAERRRIDRAKASVVSRPRRKSA